MPLPPCTSLLGPSVHSTIAVVSEEQVAFLWPHDLTFLEAHGIVDEELLSLDFVARVWRAGSLGMGRVFFII